MSEKKQNTLIGRKCRIDFACRWQPVAPQYREEEKANYAKREDWNKTGEIVAYNSTDHTVEVLRDDTGQLAEYYKGEVTITGPAENPQAEIVSLLKEIRDLLAKS